MHTHTYTHTHTHTIYIHIGDTPLIFMFTIFLHSDAVYTERYMSRPEENVDGYKVRVRIDE